MAPGPRWEGAGREEGEKAPLFLQAASAGRCVNLSKPPSGELWVPAAQQRLSWVLAPSFGTGEMIDCTGMEGRMKGWLAGWLDEWMDGWMEWGVRGREG